MKALAILLLFLAGSLHAAPEKFLAADDVLKADGSLTLTDGGSFFVFLQDGTFQSFPSGFSGRTLKGKWSSHGTNPVTFTVKAEASWINGLSSPGDHRRIVFIVYNGFTRPAEKQVLGGKVPNGQVWGGYYIVDEFVKLPAS